jgi:hypothetical protein
MLSSWKKYAPNLTCSPVEAQVTLVIWVLRCCVCVRWYSPYLLQPSLYHNVGEHSAAEGAKFDVSNKQRIGYSEVELVQKMIDGVGKLIELEEKMAAGATAAEIEKLIA